MFRFNFFFLVSRFHADGTNIDLVHCGATGPLAWITEGRFDMDAVMYFPKKQLTQSEIENTRIKMKVKLNLNHLSASVPLVGDENISYINAALIQPMVSCVRLLFCF